MIEVLLIRNVFEGAKDAERGTLEWHPDLRVRETVPPDWEHLRDDLVPFTGIRRLAWDDEVEEGTRIAFALAPRGIDPATLAFFIFIQIASAIVMRALLPKPPRQREDNSSATYGYNGIEASRVEGEPIPLYYGELRVGGQIINEFVDDFGSAGAQYNALVSLGEGPLEQIAGQTQDTELPVSSESSSSVLPYSSLWINDSDAQDLPGVEIQTRMGSLEQAPIPKFAFSSSTVAVDTELVGPTQTPATWVPVLSYSSPQFMNDGVTSSNATWTSFGLTYSMTVEGEEAVFKVYSPEGQYFISGTNQVPGYTGIAVRYIELDGGGSPITSGGPESDGYVRLRPFRRKENLAPGSVYDVKVPLYNPQTYTRPALGNYLDFNGGGAFRTAAISLLPPAVQRPYCQRTASLTVPLTGPTWPTTGGNPASFTLEGYYYFRTIGSFGFSVGPHYSRLSDTPATSVWLKLGQIEIGNTGRSYTVAPGQTVTRYVPYVQIATSVRFHERDDETFADPSYQVRNWSSTVDNLGSYADATIRSLSTFAANTNVDANTASNTAENVDYAWEHFVFTYEADASGVSNRVQLYINGIKIIDRLTTTDAVLPSLATPTLEVRGPGGNGRMQNVAIYKGVMDQDTVTRQWNNGLGRTFINTGLYPVVFYTGASVTADASGNSNTLTTVAYDAVNFPTCLPTSLGIISQIEGTSAGTATVKKSKYKLEVLRAYYNSTATTMVDTLYWRSVSLRTYEPYSYPTAPLIAVSVTASSEISGAVPRITAKIKGRKVPIWDGQSLEYPQFDIAYSRNPAWIAVDMLLDKEWGLGSIFENTDLDVASFKEWADHADEIIYNQSGYTVTYGTSSTPGTLSFRNIYYNASDSAFNLTPTITFFVPVDSIPDTIKVGEHIGIYGATVVTGFADLNNTSTSGGYEILALSRGAFGGTTYDTIICQYSGAAPFTSLAFWTTELTTFGGGAPAGTIQGRHPRFCYDGAIDQQASAWDTLLAVCASGRATPIRYGRRIRVAVHKARPIVEIVGPSQIEQGTFEVDYLSPATRFNQIEIGFLDRDLNYERSMISTEHESIQGTTNSGLLRRKQFFQEGVTRRPQIARQAKFLLNMEYEIRRKGRFIGSVDLLGLEPLDVFRIAHDVIDRGVSGRVYQTSAAATDIYLDRDITLAAATSYKVTLRSASAAPGTVPEQLPVSSVAGSYPLGTPITVTGGFVQMPAKDDVFVLNIDGADLLAQVDSINLTPDLKREVQWTEYVEAVFDVEAPGTTPDIGSEFLVADSPALGTQSAPKQVSQVRVEEVVARGPGGVHQPRLSVSWGFESGDSDQTAGFDVWLAFGTRPPYYFELKSSVGPRARSTVIDLDGPSVGDIYIVAVAARSAGQVARTPDRATKASVRIRGRSPRPSAPSWDSEYASVMDGEQATYRIVPGSREQGNEHEIRVGGWLLGQRVGQTTATGKFGPTPNWSSGVTTSLSSSSHLHGLLLPAAPLVARSVSEKGKWSSAATTWWSPSVVNAESVVDSGNNTYFTRSWEDYGIGWRRSGAVTPNASLSGCQVTTSLLFPQGYLEFSGSNLTATYTTASGLVAVDARSEWWYNSAFAIAEQIWPTTWAQATYAWDDVENQLTWEGPLNELENGDDPGRVTLKIETRVMDEDGNYSEWTQHTPGKVRGLQAQWRLTMTRPSTSYNIRVYHFATQLVRIPRQRFERSGLQYFAEHQIFGRT